MPKAFLLTGSNIGNSLQFLQDARKAIGNTAGKVLSASSVYRTAPWGNTSQQDFLNQVLCIETELSPVQLLELILQTEIEMGRVREQKWAPRTIDIDILFYGNEVISEPGLHVPHPLLHERRFTLVPLAEIAPGLIHPLLKQSVQELLASCPDHSVVEKL